MTKAYVVKQGPMEMRLETQPHEHDPELSVQENVMARLESQLRAAQEVLKFFGYQVEEVDI